MTTEMNQTQKSPSGVLGGAANTAPAGAPDDLLEVEMTVPAEGREREFAPPVFDSADDGMAARHMPVEWPRPRLSLRRRLAGVFDGVAMVLAAVVGLYAIAAGAVPLVPAGLPQMAATMVALLPSGELAARFVRWVLGRREDWDELEPLV